MIINGTTARYLLQALGLVQAAAARLRLRERARAAIEAKAAEVYRNGHIAGDRDADDAEEHVTACVETNVS